MNSYIRTLLVNERDTLIHECDAINLSVMEQALSDADAQHDQTRIAYSDLLHAIAGHNIPNRVAEGEQRKVEDAAGKVAKARNALEQGRRRKAELQAQITALGELLVAARSVEAAA